MKFKDYYQTLGVARDASQDDIKRAYRKLARRYHPDVSKEPDAEARFKDVTEANEVLKDPEKRLAYDQLGEDYKSGQEFRAPPGWDEGFEFHEHSFNEHGNAAGFSDFFDNLFARQARSHAGSGGGGRRSAQPGGGMPPGPAADGDDTHARVLIDIEAAYTGATRTLTLKHATLDEHGRPRLQERTLEVAIPRGIRAGQRIRLAGQGEPAFGRGRAGDLYLEVDFAPHPRYTVAGREVMLDVPVAPWELALGGEVEVDLPTGPVQLTIPAGSGPQQRLRLRGRGIPGSPPGDLMVTLRLVMPTDRSEASLAAWRALANAAAFDPRAHRRSTHE